MGRNCLILSTEIFALLLWLLGAGEASLRAQQDQILLPDAPQVKSPPPRKKDWQLEDDIKRKRQEHVDKKMEEPTVPVPDPEEKETQALIEETLKPRPFRFMLSSFLLYPHIIASPPRKKFVVEPSALVQTQFRLFSDRDIDTVQPWIGFRAAFFNGSGSVDDVGGRFNFLYFGPTIGLGKFGLAPRSLPKEAEKDAGLLENLTAQSGWLWLGGIAAQSRTAKLGEGDKPPKEDLNSKGFAFDAPGVWSEIIYARIHWGTITTNYLAGIQTGKGKYIFYIGFGVGGIY